MDFKEIKELIKVFDKSELNKLKVKDGEFEISLQKGFESGIAQAPLVSSVAPAPIQPVPALVPATNEKKQEVFGDLIKSPMVGSFYSAPSPESPIFASVGDVIKKGQTLCILEAMKIMNEVEAEFDCKILKVLVENGSPVEYDMPLFEVEKI